MTFNSSRVPEWVKRGACNSTVGFVVHVVTHTAAFKWAVIHALLAWLTVFPPPPHQGPCIDRFVEAADSLRVRWFDRPAMDTGPPLLPCQPAPMETAP